MSDSITILRSRGLRMAKLWKVDGTIEPYANARHFTAEQAVVDDIHDLSDLLARLEHEPSACIVRAVPKPEAPMPLRRLLENFEDHPLHTVLIEVDQYRPLFSDALDGEAAALEYIAEHLPPEFGGASFHWQLSNSAGAPGKEGLFKGHIWMWIDTPYDSATLHG